MKSITEKLGNFLKVHLIAVMAASFVLCILAGTSLILLYFYQKVSEHPVLKLKEEEITVQKGETIDPMNYIEEYSSEEGTLILPAYGKFENEGTYALVYRLSFGEDEIFRTLLVHVEDQ